MIYIFIELKNKTIKKIQPYSNLKTLLESENFLINGKKPTYRILRYSIKNDILKCKNFIIKKATLKKATRKS